MYGIWCISTEEWVGEYSKDGKTWIPETYSSASAAREDLYAWTKHTGGRKNYDVCVYRSKVQGDGSVPRSSSEPISNRKGNNRTSVHGRTDKNHEGSQGMSFKVKCKKHESGDGSYVLAYGKGKKKLTARLTKGTGFSWHIDTPKLHAIKKRDAVVEWSMWAEKEYQTAPVSAAAVTTPVTKGPPKLGKNQRKSSGPPVFKRSSAPALAVNRPSHPDYQAERTDVIDDNENPYHGDTTNKRLFIKNVHTGSWILTELGALDETFNWMQKNLPFTATLEYPWVRVTKVLQREFPDETKYQSTGA